MSPLVCHWRIVFVFGSKVCIQRASWLNKRWSIRFRRAIANIFAMRDRGEMAEPMFPGVMETLKALMAPDVFMAIVTGKDLPGLTRVLDHHSFGHFFAGNLNTPTHYAGKPSPEMLIGAMEKSMQDLEDTVVIGDTVFDILMAQNAGVASVGVSYGNHSADRLIDAGADVIIDDFADLPEALVTIS